VRSTNGGFASQREAWKRAPGMRPSWVFEREAGTCAKALGMAAFLASIGELARRALPSDWNLYVMLATVTAIAVGTGALLTRARE